MEKQPHNPLTLADLHDALTGLATTDDLNVLATQEALSALTTKVTTIQETVNAIMETVAGTKEDVTLLVKSRRSISNVMGESFTGGMYPIALAFKRCMQEHFAARF